MMNVESRQKERVDSDFDHYSTEYAENPHAVEHEMRGKCPMAWSERHGGFWVATSYEGFQRALQDLDLCSSEKFDAEGNVVGGQSIPPYPGSRMIPDETDPPEWAMYRRLVSPSFAPAAVERRRAAVEAFAIETVNSVIEKGEADFVHEIASPVTALITMDILGLPLGDWDTYSGPIRRNAICDVSMKGVEISERIYPRLAETVAARRLKPETGLVDELIAARPEGEALSDQTIIDMIWQILVGGFSTTSALLSWSIYYLDQHREDHQDLIDDDRFLRIATEEFVRWSSPVNTLARTVTRDVEIEGQQISAGDRMLFMFGAANRDPKVFDSPDEVQLERFPNRHLGWGTGIHRCLGSNLARLVFQETLRQVLRRMPDFSVDQERAQREPDRAGGNGWISLPLRFTPGPRVHTEYAYLSEFF